MPENKTKPTRTSVDAFVAGIADERERIGALVRRALST